MNKRTIIVKRFIRTFLSFLLIVFLFSEDVFKVSAEEYEYDELNRVKKVIYDDGSYVEYSYDKNGNILNTVVFDAVEEKTEEPEETGESEETGETETSEESKETESGTTPDPDTPGIIDQIINAIENFFEKIGDFIGNIFS